MEFFMLRSRRLVPALYVLAILSALALAYALTPNALANGLPVALGYPSSTVSQLPSAICTPNVVAYDIVYVRTARFGDDENSIWTDTVRPLSVDPGAELR